SWSSRGIKVDSARDARDSKAFSVYIHSVVRGVPGTITRLTPSRSGSRRARYLRGMASRFLASIVCSYWPVNSMGLQEQHRRPPSSTSCHYNTFLHTHCKREILPESILRARFRSQISMPTKVA